MSATLFDTSDSSLEELLTQAKETLAQKKQAQIAEEKSNSKNKKTEGTRALSVPLKINAELLDPSKLLLQTSKASGVTRLNTKTAYSDSNSSTGIDSVIEEKKPAPDPTAKRLTKKAAMEAKQQTAGKNWFGMKAPVVTDELKNDLRVLQLRNVLDPKRFYKKSAGVKKIPKYFEMGTVIEGATEFYSARMTRKERKSNIVDELLADKQARDYFKRKVGEIHAHNNSGRGGRRGQIKPSSSSGSKRHKK
ncbi:rrna-processing protein fcf2 [Coemansia asiatica]|uniref:Rrna-processing protein fcf2 n=1 Tax=Coemansia asiatica TaxID=1052880 RepID=A0A9W7XHQ7_9FUNG|nr:rrna-processing protein fcf2 [Coemansia asiatica]KAJ2872396.1 rrna-processing protein fcf2 [Coemansia asiatica]